MSDSIINACGVSLFFLGAIVCVFFFALMVFDDARKGGRR